MRRQPHSRPAERPADAQGRVRIIGGSLRSRVLRFQPEPGLRPTPDRVRVTLFNWLRERLPGAACLDLFAGSGALGFEAASHGAAQVTLVESNSRAAAALRQHVTALATPQVEVRCEDALTFLRACPRRYDVVFLDPPYDAGLLPAVLKHLPTALKPGALVYLEMRDEVPMLPDYLEPHRSGTAGQIGYALTRARLPDTAASVG